MTQIIKAIVNIFLLNFTLQSDWVERKLYPQARIIINKFLCALNLLLLLLLLSFQLLVILLLFGILPSIVISLVFFLVLLLAFCHLCISHNGILSALLGDDSHSAIMQLDMLLVVLVVVPKGLLCISVSQEILTAQDATDIVQHVLDFSHWRYLHKVLYNLKICSHF